MRYIYFGILSLVLCLVGGCSVSDSLDVSESLYLAGANRAELHRVLEHYERDKQKYRAACFLIANMKYHQSDKIINVPPEYCSFFEQVDSACRGILQPCPADSIFRSKKYNELRRRFASDFQKMPVPQYHIGIPDLQMVTADELIENIDTAFSIWTESPYAASLDFDDFLEMILPYRTVDETFPVGKAHLSALFDNCLFADSVLDVTNRIGSYKDYVKRMRWLTDYIPTEHHMGVYDLFTPKFKNDCQNISAWTCNIFRACGIPAVYEFTPMWQDRSRRHFWCAVPDSLGIVRPFTPPNNNLMEDWDSDLKYAGKVYRKTFGANECTPYFIADKNECIPGEFRSPLLSDQTYRYHQTVTLTMPFDKRTNNNLAYLCFFANDDEGLSPVAWGMIDHSKQTVTFEQVPLNIVFFPAYYEGDRLVPFGDAFILKTDGVLDWLPEPHTLTLSDEYREPLTTLTNGKLQFIRTQRLVPDITYHVYKPQKTTASIKLLRKYPEKRSLKKKAMHLSGALLLGSQFELGPHDTLCTLSNVPGPYLQDVGFENHRKYRYYRLATADGGPVNIAHMEFLGRFSPVHKCVSPTDLPDFGAGRDSVSDELFNIVGVPIKTGSKPYDAFDGNMLTYCGSSSLGMDFGTPVCITRMRFVPRNADNMIKIGDTYTLYYYDSGWRYHSTTVASANYLQIDHVPEGTIYWLVNETRGREELPFTYSGNQQHFINLL